MNIQRAMGSEREESNFAGKESRRLPRKITFELNSES
jgi:hypothetical protein